MPPIPKINKDDILKVSFELVKEKGIDSFNARNIAEKLNCSTRPIFTCYKNMAELKSELIELADKYCINYFKGIKQDENFFLNVAIFYVDFAIEEKNLFKFLFMSDNIIKNKFLGFMDEDNKVYIKNSLPKNIDFKSAKTKKIFLKMWLYAHGIASMLVTNNIKISKEEIIEMLSEIFFN